MKQVFFFALAVVMLMGTPAQAADISIRVLDESEGSITRAFVDQSAESLKENGTQGVYIATFTVTTKNVAVYIPKATLRTTGTMPESEVGVVYSMRDSGDQIETQGKAAALILSDAETVGEMYKVPKDTTETFTLLGVFDNTGNTADYYHLQIDGIGSRINYTNNPVFIETHGLESFNTKEIKLGK